ncbi:MAG: signal peptide peptidase SppA [Novosphingobium sp.]
MSFARKAWHILVAVKDGLALMFLLLFFILLYGALTARPSAGTVREGALLLKLNGTIVEEPSVIDPLQGLLSGAAPIKEYRARDLVRALRVAAKDERIKAVVFDLTSFQGGGQVHMQDIGEAMDAVRAAKKPVLTYGSLYADDAVLLAAHASESWVDPMGGALVFGPGGKHAYYGGLLDRLKISAHVFRVGTYKSAVEPYLRNDMSPESREASASVYAAMWDSWKADVAKARPKANIRLATEDPAAWLKASGGDAAQAAVAAGLIDKVGTRADFGKRVAEIAGPDKLDTAPGNFAHTSLKSWLAANRLPDSGKPIGVITIAGVIVDGNAGPGTAGGDRIAKLLDEAQEQDLAALVIRVDSPGGSVAASERIREAIERQKARKIPVVVSMANLAASGGYWVSTPGTRIFAEPSTITGSIGIFAVLPTFERALSEYGITTDGVKTTPISGEPDFAGGISPQLEGMLQANIEHGYARFIGLVGNARGKTPKEIDAIAQGRVWDGGTARQNGLVDQFGGLDDALAFAANAAGLKEGEWHAFYLGADADPYAALIERLSGDDEGADPAGAADWAGLVADRQSQRAAEAIAGARRLLTLHGAQALCLECPSTAPEAGAKGSTAGLFDRFLVRLSGLI